ncbi:hypothetical protein Bbelb_373280 [Branchiostoma belcheri]|nr:hypothetical protein Bbelb_373280 [Branchiostoma belcheri]
MAQRRPKFATFSPYYTTGDSVWSGNNAQSRDNGIEVRIFADSLFRDVDPDRAFQGKSTKFHRNSTITAAITNIRNMKDAATKTVILHVGSNDLDNNKHKQEATPRPYVQQPNMANPWGGHRWSSQPTPPKRHNFAPVRGWSQPGPAPPTRSFVPARGGLRGEHARSNANTVPLGPRIPSRQTSTANPTAENQVSSSLHVVKPAVLTTLQQGTLKHLKLPWKQVGKNIRKAWNTLMS